VALSFESHRYIVVATQTLRDVLPRLLPAGWFGVVGQAADQL
jgi:hypothetical protein